MYNYSLPLWCSHGTQLTQRIHTILTWCRSSASCVTMETNPDVARVTSEQRSKWDDSARSYNEVLIRKGAPEPNSRQVIAAVVEHTKENTGFWVLDVASNGGNPAVPLAKALPHAQVLATDLSPIAVSFISSYAKAEGVTNVTAQPADAQNLEQFQDCTFAAVTCSYGLMFMPDHAQALREAYRVLQPGGLYVATVWAPLETFQLGQMFVQVTKEVAGDTPLPSTPYTPWRFGNPLQLLQDLKEANFSNVQCTSYSHDMTFTLPDLIAFQLGPHGQSRPTLEKLRALGRDNIDEEAQKVMHSVLETQGRLHEGKAHFKNKAMLFTAIKQ